MAFHFVYVRISKSLLIRILKVGAIEKAAAIKICAKHLGVFFLDNIEKKKEMK